MKSFKGTVVDGYRLATPNLNQVMELIKSRTGFALLELGTLNVELNEEYIVKADALITAEEYGGEALKLKRCLIGGRKALIVRPEKHETVPGYGHGTAYFEIMAPVHLRNTLRLSNGHVVEVQVEGDAAWWDSGV